MLKKEWVLERKGLMLENEGVFYRESIGVVSSVEEGMGVEEGRFVGVVRGRGAYRQRGMTIIRGVVGNSYLT